ncbi:hypothetical protein N7452_004269 [Penicillium brevicompactum]|uniref:Uncharacterized protein n=1 Tax=Penicillium brevicompactum TaxID=5074 RepID=A0A9W9QV23_PENBR|nr:hypothetical protein N7452_004269 [Penicillium brevicompactum]
MADPPTGGPEPPPTNTQESIASVTEGNLEARATIDSRKRTRTTQNKLLEIKHNHNVIQEQNKKLYNELHQNWLYHLIQKYRVNQDSPQQHLVATSVGLNTKLVKPQFGVISH